MAKLNKFVTEYILQNYKSKTTKQIYQELNKYTKSSVTVKDIERVIKSDDRNAGQPVAPTPVTPKTPSLAKTTVTHPIRDGVISMMTHTGSQQNDEHKKRLPKSHIPSEFIMDKNKK